MHPHIGLRSCVSVVACAACTTSASALVTFEFTYFDPAGVGFNAPSTGDAFKAVLEDIAGEVGGLIQQDATVKIGVAPSQFDATGFSALASATFLGTDPPASGFFDGEVIDRIVNGTPHPGTPGPCDGFECDGAVVVDLGYTWSLDSTPGPAEVHFRSVMLHEMTHMLGFGSFIATDGTGYNGVGLIGTTPDIYTRFDSFVTTAAGDPLIGPTATPRFAPALFPSIMATGLSFSGPNTLAAGGITLGFLDPSHSADIADVMYIVSPSGYVKEVWTPIEVAVLNDLGYQFVTELQGDLDSDGFVGITDLNIVLSNWNLSVPPGDLTADPSGDGFVGIEDLNIVLGNWNAGTPPSTPIPEPGVLAVMGVASFGLLRRRRV